MADEERNIVGKHGHLHVFGYVSPKVVDVQQEEEPQQDGTLRDSVDLHFGLSVWEDVAEPLRICNREAVVNCSDKKVFLPHTVECLGVVKKGQDGLLQHGSLISAPDRLREAQGLAFACSILTESCLFSAELVPGFLQVVESVVENPVQRLHCCI